MLRKIDVYKRVLERYSKPLLKLIEWRATDRGYVEVLNNTANFYRYFDATAHAEFLYDCVRETVEEDLPREVKYLESYDRFVARVQTLFDMPSSRLDLLWRFLAQNEGKLSQRARAKEFAALTDNETSQIENMFEEAGGAG